MAARIAHEPFLRSARPPRRIDGRADRIKGSGAFQCGHNSLRGAGTPRDLSPGEKDGYYSSLILQVWEPLVNLGEDGAPAPALATDWQMSDDGKEWTISLREQVTFHDGEPFNADAVIANIDRVVQHSPKKSPFYTLDAAKTYPGLERVEKVADHTVKLVFNVPSPSAIQRLTGNAHISFFIFDCTIGHYLFLSCNKKIGITPIF